MNKFKKIQEENILIPKKHGLDEERASVVKDENDPSQLLTVHL